MRNLTLDEKISIKGELSLKGFPPCSLLQLKMADAARLYMYCFGRPVAMHSTPTMWNRRIHGFNSRIQSKPGAVVQG